MSFQTSLKEYPARKLADTVLEDHVREKLQSVARDFAPTEAKWFQNRGLLWRRGENFRWPKL